MVFCEEETTLVLDKVLEGGTRRQLLFTLGCFDAVTAVIDDVPKQWCRVTKLSSNH